MLTLSDELKIRYVLDEEDIGNVISYTLSIVSSTTEVIYHGQVYYNGPSYIYYKDIIEPYVNDYQWITKNGHTEGLYRFKVAIDFSTGISYTSDWIENKTVIPTVNTTHIPSILPRFAGQEFIFGWLCPTSETKISTSNAVADVLPSYTSTTTGHTMIDYSAASGIPYNEKGIYRLTNQAQKIAEFDTHKARFFLIWITRENDYMCRPFCKKSTLNESVSTSYMQTITNRKISYLKNSTFKWTLNSDWLTYDEHNVYESLLISPIVYLYDYDNDKRYVVNVTNAEWTEKNSNNNRKPFNMTVNVEMADENKITY